MLDNDTKNRTGGPKPAIRTTFAAARALADEVSREPQATVAPAGEDREQSVRLMRLLRKGIRRFANDVPKALSGRDPKAVHDLRVWSRRLQQIMLAIFGEAEPKKARAIRKTLRRARRELGSWRNHDVVLEILGARERHARSETARRAWTLVREMAQEQRKREIRRTRKRLLKLEIFGLAEDAEELIGDGLAIKATFRNEARKAYERWRAALDQASASSKIADIHKFRICTKRLRYQTELMRELGAGDTPELGWLKELQEGLGRWRDQAELGNTISRAVANPDTILNEPRASIILLTELEKLKRTADSAISDMLEKIRGSDEIARLEGWIRSDSSTVAESGPAGASLAGSAESPPAIETSRDAE